MTYFGKLKKIYNHSFTPRPQNLRPIKSSLLKRYRYRELFLENLGIDNRNISCDISIININF